MPYAVTHFLVALLLVGVWRDYFIKNKKKFPLHYVLLGGIAGVLPDLDILLFYVLSLFGFAYDDVHRTYSHALFVPLLFLVFGLFSYSFKNRNLGIHHLLLRNIFFVLAFGTFIHIILDALFVGKVMLFYPFSNDSAGFNLINFLPWSWKDSFLQSIDAAFLVLWLSYLEWKHKISDFI